MEAHHKAILQQKYMQLCRALTTDIETVVKSLRQHQVISETMEGNIMAERTAIKQAYVLVDILKNNGGSSTYQNFYRITLEAELWEAADILVPGKKPHNAGSLNALDGGDALPNDRPQVQQSSGQLLDDSLPSQWPSTEFRDEINQMRLNVNNVQRQQRDMIEKFQDPGKHGVYQMGQQCKGTVLIINNQNFTSFATRIGSKKDRKALDLLFNALNFSVIVEPNLTKTKMLDIMKQECAKLYHGYNCFILIILSHGAKGVVFGTDGAYLDDGSMTNFMAIEDIKEMFCSVHSLAGKPKLFFIEACQNVVDLNKDEPKDVSPSTEDSLKTNHSFEVNRIPPNWADTFTVLATTEGGKAYGKTEFGSWFIQAIVCVFAKRAYRQTLKELIQEVKVLVHKASGGEQVAKVEESMVPNFYFFPGLPLKP